MPGFAPGLTYPDLDLKAPLGLRVIIPELNLQNAIAEVGQNNIASVKWGLKIWVCPPTNPSCKDPIEAGEVDLIYDGNQFLLQIIIGSYYMTKSATLQYNYPEGMGKISDLILDVYFLGQARMLSCTSAYLDSSGKPVNGNNEYLTYNVLLLHGVNIGQIVDADLPTALKIPLIMVLPRSLLRTQTD